MRRFRVWVGCTSSKCSPVEAIIEVDDNEAAEDACIDAINDLFGNVFESGWEEVND